MRTLQNYVKMIALMDGRRRAWETSRPGITEKDISFDKVMDMDFSLNSMMVYTLEIRSSVIFRDLLLSVRPIEAWAMSIRNMPVNLDTVCLSSEFEDRDDYYAQILKMFKLMDEGASRDQARDVLPLAVSTTYTITIDFRALMGFCKAIEERNPRLFMEYCVPMLDETGTEHMYTTTKVRSSLPYLMIQENERTLGVKEVGNMMFGHYQMKMAMASQFLRQHYSKIKIGLWNELDNYYDLDMDQSDKIDVAFYIDTTSYNRLMQMRSHWLIDWSNDMWGSLVGDHIKGMTTLDFWEFTPAGGGRSDPYFADGMGRVLMKDPGVPCPIMTECRAMINKRRRDWGDSPILDKYDQFFISGLVVDNPDNEYLKQYLASGGTL
jgi:hypothetical protein